MCDLRPDIYDLPRLCLLAKCTFVQKINLNHPRFPLGENKKRGVNLTISCQMLFNSTPATLNKNSHGFEES